MLKTELLEIVANGENSGIEFKRDDIRPEDLGKEVVLTVTKVGLSDMAMAVTVGGFTSKNEIPHITIGVNPDGGKPKMSNDIRGWQDLRIFHISGIVTEIKK